MNDQDKTKKQLSEELKELRKQFVVSKQSAIEYSQFQKMISGVGKVE